MAPALLDKHLSHPCRFISPTIPCRTVSPSTSSLQKSIPMQIPSSAADSILPLILLILVLVIVVETYEWVVSTCQYQSPQTAAQTASRGQSRPLSTATSGNATFSEKEGYPYIDRACQTVLTVITDNNEAEDEDEHYEDHYDEDFWGL